MGTTSPTIPTETARHVLWTFGHRGGYQPGTYHQKLLDLLAYAPPVEVAKLAQIYPAEAEAVRMAKYDEDGIDKLKRAAGLVCIRCGDEDGPFAGAPRQPLCEGCARPMPLDGVA
ncbi:hypothetical protein [Streptomyces acidicola]|uniref:Uncharacterized protein n=1 Tax=Streptomyces acidicola TaxID=2596892 RepID=A0A5N8WKN5_9ACTN|nr:hypothetical protein [Streptomyces acidicola]MPY47074.1 hypothetical protein [Streptomyces acidicola]MPY47213.1 hypothetical protein [Streptomyces acidicola]